MSAFGGGAAASISRCLPFRSRRGLLAALDSRDPRRLLQLGASRGKASGKLRYNLVRQRALEGHIDYLRQLEPPRPSRRLELDPKVDNRLDNLRHQWGHPKLVEQPMEEMQLLSPEAALAPAFGGQLGKVELEPFGSIEVVHGDIFVRESDVVILPMTPNLMPYRGLGLETLDRGGTSLVEDMFKTAMEKYQKEGLQAGDTILVKGSGVAAKTIVFVIMPWFWQGSAIDAAKRFRYCVRCAFQNAADAKTASSVALPSIGAGIFGYEPHKSSRILLEESLEQLLQIEASVPMYQLREIAFVESRRETAELLQKELTELAHRWLPGRRVTTAPQFWGKATRRLLLLPARPNFFWKKHKVKFKTRHGVKRRQRKDYLSNVKPLLWRCMRVAQPPPLLVLQESGEPLPSERQLKARPYFFRGVTHWLFPSRRSGFHALKKRGGHWVGSLKKFDYAAATRPRS